MASEIRVNKLNSQTGVGTITLSPTGVDISGITTAETLKATTGIVTTLTANTTKITTGIVTTLTATTGIVTTLTTNTLTANSTAKVGSGVTLSPDGDIFVTGVTTSSTVKVGGGVTISESGIEASGIGITCASINGTQIGGRRNIVINGAMQIAQRGTSSTTVGYQTLDRYYLDFTGTDEAPTQEQADVSSGDDGPYQEGFRKCYKITNGNQTGGAGSSDGIFLNYTIEAQDIANSGWNYTSSSSFVTLSFWVNSSVAQNFYGRLYSYDGTAQGYAFETGSLTAGQWKKVVLTIPGNSNLTFDNNNGAGLLIELVAFRGTGFTASMTLNQWAAYNSNSRVPDMTSTWYTTNDATLEFTGIQLEVGSQATAFEHRSFGEELALCQRYYQKSYDYATALGTTTSTASILNSAYDTISYAGIMVQFKVRMRATPTCTIYSTTTGATGKMNADSTVGNAQTTQEGENGFFAYRQNDNSGVGGSAFMRIHYQASADL